MFTVTALYVYPIKSLGGISLQQAVLTDRGLAYDRRWMLVDRNNRFLSQRECQQMALLQVGMDGQGLVVRRKGGELAVGGDELAVGGAEAAENGIARGQAAEALPGHAAGSGASFRIPAEPEGDRCIVEVWDDHCEAQYVSEPADEWFSSMLSLPCRLVYMPDSSQRLVDGQYAFNQEITSFSDGYPLLLIGQASLDDLNQRLDSPVPMDRFRPNVVFEGGEPYQEDDFKHFQVAGISFFGVKRCARCVITTIDQDSAVSGKEPLRTLSRYRRVDNKVFFGQNLLFKGEGTLSVGDPLTLV